MKAALALIILYVGTFFISLGDAQQGAAAPVETAAVDPAKEADIRSLLELTGFTEIVKSAGERTSAQYTEKIQSAMKNRERGQELATAFRENFQEHFSAAEMSGELVRQYDQDFTADEIRELLKFYSSPLGQKFGAETPKMAEGMQRAVMARSESAARETWRALRAGNPELGEEPRRSLRGQRGGGRARP